jgi:hypothetical protein
MGFNENEEHLYHFTTFEAAVKILATNELRFSKTNNANDILESNRLISFNLEAFKSKTFNPENIYNEIIKYRQISLTSDDFSCKPYKYGFCINPMWGHYADSGNGVCIVLNKEKLLAKLSKDDCHYGNIEYVENYDNTLDINSKNNSNIIKDVKEFVANNLHETFFKKTTDWQYEQEFRIVKRANSGNNGNLDIKGCIDCVIINRAKDISPYESAFSSSQYEVLKKLYDETCIYKYGVFFGSKGLSNKEGDSIWSEMPNLLKCDSYYDPKEDAIIITHEPSI